MRERLVSTGYAARLLGVSDRAVRYWAAHGRIDALQTPTGRWRIRLVGGSLVPLSAPLHENATRKNRKNRKAFFRPLWQAGFQ